MAATPRLATLRSRAFVANAWKGYDIASVGLDREKSYLLSHPRRERWSDHFRFDNGEIVPLPETGAATECHVLSRSRRYPGEN